MVLADDSYLKQDEPEGIGNIRLHAYAPNIVCDECGTVYVSTGKYDPGICPECQKKKIYFGGPLEGGTGE